VVNRVTTTPGRPQISAGRKFLYTSVLCLALLLAGEAALRIRQWVRYGASATAVRDPMLVYDRDADLFVPKPGYELTGGRIHIKINSLGFRGDEITREKPANTVRIVCLGASTTFSAESSSNQTTWPHRLQEKLREAHPSVRFEVVNAAVGGYVAADSLKNLRHRVVPLDPDLVIYYEANNEIVRDTGELARREGLIENAGRPPIVSFLSEYSIAFDLVYKNLAILWRSRAGSSRTMDRIPPDLPTRFVGVLEEMRSELARKNIPLMLSTFLVKYRRGQDRRTQIANADVAFYYMPWMSIDGMLDAMDVYNRAILDYARLKNLPVVDDREAIPPDADHYADCMHLADKGSGVMAERFHRALRDSGLLDRLVASRTSDGSAGVGHR
jgi:hypothetical protein